MSTCKVCGKEIPPTGKRGRPAKTCAECKAKAAEAKKTKPVEVPAAPPTVPAVGG